MGIDWYRMQLKPGTSRIALEDLRDRQAAAFYACGLGRFGWIDEFDAPPIPANHQPRDDYLQASRLLKSVLDIPERHESLSFAPCFRVYPVTHTPVFPSEWQEKAHRTFFPDELPSQLAEWQRHIARVRAGHYQAYLLQKYVYVMGLYLYKEWYYLVKQAEKTRQRTNNWAMKPIFLTIRDEVTSATPPALPIAPLWAYWKEYPDAPVVDVQHAYEEQQENHRRLIELMRRWDRSVPGSWKIQRYHAAPYQSFESFLASATDPWLDEFFAWASRCCTEKMGLFLDY